MPNGKTQIAEAFYIAQTQACKGKCQCIVCKVLRKASDLQAASFLNPEEAKPLQTKTTAVFPQGAPFGQQVIDEAQE